MRQVSGLRSETQTDARVVPFRDATGGPGLFDERQNTRARLAVPLSHSVEFRSGLGPVHSIPFASLHSPGRASGLKFEVGNANGHVSGSLRVCDRWTGVTVSCTDLGYGNMSSA